MNFRYWARQGIISNRPPDDERVGRARRGQGGQALVLFAVFITVILGTAALVLDQGLLRKANYDLTNALDAGALAGVSMVLDDPALAEQTAREYVQLNYPDGLPDSDITVGFRCLIGAEAGVARTSDVPTVCDPGPGATWTVSGKIAYATCVPSPDHVCNTIVVSGPATVDYNFAPVLGIEQGSTGARSAAACKGSCGEPPEVPVDLVVILDRTTSMSGVDTGNARNAANTLRKSLDPQLQWLGLSVLGPSKLGAFCKTQADSVIGSASTADLRRWVPIGLTGAGASFGSSYTSDTSAMATAITCFGNSSTRTDLADPVRMATYELQTYGRSNAKKAILLLSDGQPNISTTSTSNYCLESDKAATAAKKAGIEVFTVGFGLDGYNDMACPDPSDPWKGHMATELLASMATDSVRDGGCPGTENSDGDNYYCLPKTAGASTDLADVFQVAVQKLTGHSRLVNVD
jgi:von Willebrand factor type A domain/Putative Flp pilus-assembly TadE/G-like